MFHNSPSPAPYSPLPIDPVLPELVRAVAASPNVVLHAPPGAGKTTRVPLALYNIPELGRGRVVMLEPRRLAAAHAAHRMAALLGESTGETVGYAMRFERRVSQRTRIEVVTEGILTRRLQRDPCLEGVSLVLFDEFHERSIHADLALALCLEVQREVRPDLKILVMSATLDCGPVAALLGDAPVIASQGSFFPVEIRYQENPGHDHLPARMAAAVRRALAEEEGDILAFLPGSGEIHACHAILRQELSGSSLAIHPLYGDLPFAEQEQAIVPGPIRKVVLATNIAETSITIEGVRVVLDSGLSRTVRYEPSCGMNRLVTVRESRASAEQRAGRAGRTRPGVCCRLFSPHTFNAMIPFSPPEISVADLSSLVLELAVWGVREPASLSWLDPPPEAAVASARDLLRMLGALDRAGRATDIGRRMAELPVHPRVARLLLRGLELGVPRQACILAALLSERDVFRYGPGESASVCESDLVERYEAVIERQGRVERRLQDGAARAVERTASHLARLVELGGDAGCMSAVKAEDAARMLLAAYPDRVAVQREEGSDRYLLATGRGARLSKKCGVRNHPCILAVQVDAGATGEGLIHQACTLDPGLVRSECGDGIVTERKVGWDGGLERVMGWEVEMFGSLALSRRQVTPSDDEALPVLLEVVRSSGMAMLHWNRDILGFRGRVRLLREAFPEAGWPDLSDEQLVASLQEWLGPFLPGIRSGRDLAGVDLMPALTMLLSREHMKLLERLAPTHVTVPSGRRAPIDYTSGAEPLLAVKLQEMFGLADTPSIAGGRVRLLLHLLSPAGRPVQVTRDLRNFWENGYREVRKELRGRYPKHPWPDDPWNAVATGKTSRMLKDAR